jgi:hypothetical protein
LSNGGGGSSDQHPAAAQQQADLSFGEFQNVLQINCTDAIQIAAAFSRRLDCILQLLLPYSYIYYFSSNIYLQNIHSKSR